MMNQGDKVTLKPCVTPISGQGVYTGCSFAPGMVGEITGKHPQNDMIICLVRAWQYEQGVGLMQFLIPFNLLMPSTDTTPRVKVKGGGTG